LATFDGEVVCLLYFRHCWKWFSFHRLDFSKSKRFSNRLKMNRDKLFFRHVLLYYFDLKKTAVKTRLLFEVYGDKIPSEKTCRVWFELFRNGDFDVRWMKNVSNNRKNLNMSSKNWWESNSNTFRVVYIHFRQGWVS